MTSIIEPTLSSAHRTVLQKAFEKILGPGIAGAVAFVRCLDAKVVRDLINDEYFSFEGWDVRAVGAECEGRFVTADRAVEIREDKDMPTLLLVDIQLAGAGMDGIYSAAREISEKILLKEAIRLVRSEFSRDSKKFGELAIKRSKRVGERNSVSLWREFDFYASALSTPESLPKYVGRLGLWPINLEIKKCREEHLDISARMVERLLLNSGFGSTAGARLKSLMLRESSDEQDRDLKRFIAQSVDIPPEEALVKIEADDGLMIGSLMPEFSSQSLLKIDIRTWRTNSKKVAKWTGLTDAGVSIPVFMIDREATSTSQYSKLEVRWETKPEEIVAGSVEYRVTIQAGDEELASRTVAHTNKSPQVVRFTNEDFEDMDQDSKFETFVQIVAIGSDTVEPEVTEDFLLQFGVAPEEATAGSGRRVRSIVEGVIPAKTLEDFLVSCSDASTVVEDRQGFITFRPKMYSGTSSRVHRPSFLKLIETKWSELGGISGRWTVRVRSDGTRVGEPAFVKLELSDVSAMDRINKVSAKFCREVKDWQSSMGRVYCGDTKIVDDYLSTWTSLIESCDRDTCLANTVEVQTMSGHVIGIIVLPMHPVRVAWQLAYDNLVVFARYSDNLAFTKVNEAVSSLNSSHFPFALPGLIEGSAFIFGDTLGFHCIAMVSDQDREPKAAIAQMATCLGEGKADISPTQGTQMSEIIAKELRRYLEFHPLDSGRSNLLHINSMRPGDGATISKALALTLNAEPTNSDDEAGVDLCFVAELFPAKSDSDVTGTYLSNVVERNRAGASGVAESDKWIVESVTRPGGVTIPRLRWARRDYSVPKGAAHVSIVFDAFAAKLKCVPLSTLPEKSPLHAFGLTANIQRQFKNEPTPTWQSYISFKHDGEKHPKAKSFTDRLNKIQNAILISVTKNLGYDSDYWPVIQTEMSGEAEEELVTLHRQSDWVITIDRNAGIEFFDSPLDSRAIYDAYVIDCIPERSELAGLQLLTSTTQSDEIRDLLDHALGLMGLSTSLRNCQFLLGHLKALSGRLAIRLSSQNTSSGELIALALLNASCKQSSLDSDAWLPLQRGYFVPLDDVIGLVPSKHAHDEGESKLRADLLYVGLTPRGSMYFTFVEVKYRRHLRMARDPLMLEKAQEQMIANSKRWMDWFFNSKSEVAAGVRRSDLAQVLRFYVDKAARHHLGEKVHLNFLEEINKMLVKGSEYRLSDPSELGRGFVFCPELTSHEPVLEPTTEDTGTPIFLFGPSTLPDFAAEMQPPAGPSTGGNKPVLGNSDRENTGNSTGAKGSNLKAEKTSSVSHPSLACSVNLGKDRNDGENVYWNLSISSNPHLMLVGLPGMGKTTTLLGVCDQLIKQGITPIVFSYHQDIDEKMVDSFENTQLFEPTDLGFNPMQVNGDSPLGYIDNAGQLRDIFSSMYSDLGDIQLDKIRNAIKESYTAKGWGQNQQEAPATPAFRDFYQALAAEKKPDRGLLARLGELDDYGVFGGSGEVRSLLDINKPTILKIHSNQNDNVQRAFAMLALYNIYKEMFQRGVQERITHVVVFDEAHRASKMKLLPTMAKESRKFGISLFVSSQESKDFDSSLFSAIANYVLLRMTEADARRLAKNITTSDNEKRAVDRLKTLPKYQALFYSEGRSKASHVELNPFE